MKELDILIEIGIEYPPINFLKKIELKFRIIFEEYLDKYHIKYSNIKSFSESKRFGIIGKVFNKQKKYIVEKIGPSEEAVKKNKTLSYHFAKSCNVTVDKIIFKVINKKKMLYFQKEGENHKINYLLKNIINLSLKKIASNEYCMRWQENNILYKFIRPIRSIIVLLNDKIIPIELFGVKSSNVSYSHHNKIYINHVKSYINILKINNIILFAEERKKILLKKINSLVIPLEKPFFILNDIYITNIIYMISFPFVILCRFNEKYISLPKEIILLTINKQKCISVNNNKYISQYFIAVINITAIKNILNIKKNIEQTINSRLEDAYFFYKKDKNICLLDNIKLLNNISFRDGLGTLLDKINRMLLIVKYFCNTLNLNYLEKSYLYRACIFSKIDLTMNIIREFPTLSGIIGYYIALYNFEDYNVSYAIKDHYLPVSNKGILPNTKISSILSIIDKTDNFIATVLSKEKFYGNGDPFFTRRNIISIYRISIFSNIDINFSILLLKSINTFNNNHYTKNNIFLENAISFIKNKIFFWYKEQNFSQENFLYANSKNHLFESTLTFHKRILFFNNIQKKKVWEDFILIYKRLKNIIKKYYNKNKQFLLNKELFLTYEEKVLYKNILNIKNNIYIYENNFFDMFNYIYTLRIYVNNLFKNIIIFTEKENILYNRILLLQEVVYLFDRVL